MKKKIKDLTAEDCKRICDAKKECEKCPLNINDNLAVCMAELKNVDVKDLEVRQERIVHIYASK